MKKVTHIQKIMPKGNRILVRSCDKKEWFIHYSTGEQFNNTFKSIHKAYTEDLDGELDKIIKIIEDDDQQSIINEELELQECIDILNEMLQGLVDYDNGGGEVTYIIIDPNKIDCLKKLISNEGKLNEYLNGCEGHWKEDGFDIASIWTEICIKFDIHIWVNFKEKKFYIKED